MCDRHKLAQFQLHLKCIGLEITLLQKRNYTIYARALRTTGSGFLSLYIWNKVCFSLSNSILTEADC